MGKIIYENITYDSEEELDFKHWLDEAYENGLIKGYKKQEKGIDTFQLVDKQYYIKNNKKKHCLASVVYTADFIVFNCDLIKDKPTEENIIYVDVKGSFSQHNDKTQFQIKRKMMYSFKGIYVHKVVPSELFIKTFIPELCRYTKVKKDIQKKYLEIPTITEYLELINNKQNKSVIPKNKRKKKRKFK